MTNRHGARRRVQVMNANDTQQDARIINNIFCTAAVAAAAAEERRVSEIDFRFQRGFGAAM